MLEKILWNLKNLNEICYSINDEVYTYRELYRRVSNLVNFFENNCKGNEPILVYGHKDFSMIVSFLGCSFCGIPYIPVDVSMPKMRIESIINQVKPQMIIGDLDIPFDNKIDNQKLKAIFLTDAKKDIKKIKMKKNDIYYIIFTSGSTGEPKGVKVSYSNIDSCIEWLNNLILPKNEVILNQGLFSFDLSVADIYLSLVSGSNHYILDKSTQNNYEKLFTDLEKSMASIAVMTPSFADFLLSSRNFNRYLMPELNKIIFCGEKLSKETVTKLFERFPYTHIINSYGPTECTFAVTAIEITREMLNQDELSIGVPKSDVSMYIVDEELNLKKDGEVGEIIIAGKSVADGYVKETENKKFINYKGKHSYLTGDLGYKLEKNYFFCGRKDRQIKLHGYRIELLDIENSIKKIDSVEKCVVVVKYADEKKVERVFCFVKLKDNTEISEFELVKQSKLLLPNYIIPKIVIVDDFPLTQNGKCDEKRLLENV